MGGEVHEEEADASVGDASEPTLHGFAPEVPWHSDPDLTVGPPDAVPGPPVTEEVSHLPSWPEAELSISDTLGQGGMGVVRAAHQLSLGRSGAVKQLRLDRRTPAAQRKLLQEAWAAGCLEHPHIVPVYALARDADGMPMMVQKHLDGVAWSDQLRAARVGHEEGLTGERLEAHLDVLERVAQAVAFAHHRGVVHRDIKPQNVMLGRFGEVTLLDWGLALATPEGDPRLPPLKSAQRPAGTPSYMAPEQLAEDDRRCGTGTDVYLLGAVLYELVTGRPPHTGPSVAAILDRVRVNRPSMPHHLEDDARALLASCLDDEPGSRPSAEVFLDELRRYRALRGARRLLRQALDERDAAVDALAAGQVSRAIQHTSAARFGLSAAEAAGAIVDDEVRRGVAEPEVRSC